MDLPKLETLLCDLIALPTHQPGPDGHGGDERALCEWLAPHVARLGADVAVHDAPRKHGGGGAYLLATWGEPTVMLNAHIDTVPPNAGWTSSPWQPSVTADRITGLGACDIKGAVAAALHAVASLPAAARAGVALLFSGDEEKGTASVEAFLQSAVARRLERVIVCEPTSRTAGLAHRGIWGYRVMANGPGGHSSRADSTAKPVATLARLAAALDDYAIASYAADVARPHIEPGLRGTCLNLAGLSGGVAFNVIPSHAELSFSLRPPPHFDEATWLTTFQALVARIDPSLTVERTVDHAPFAARDAAAMAAWAAPHVASTVSLPFWTEAALYAAHGIDAVVIGPGDIAQAHAPDEWVAIADLHWARDTYAAMLRHGVTP